MKIGRNAPCFCGSGKKFKYCHGDLSRPASNASARTLHALTPVHEIQRQRQQGRGRPIITTQQNSARVVAVDKRVFRGPWKTFHDFLFNYIKIVLGEAWGTNEIAKSDDQKHPILRWYQLLCAELAKNVGVPGDIHSTNMTGAISAYLRLAYDLYTLEHNGAQANDPALQTKLVARLKHPAQFVGARHEIRVAATFLRAGFRLEWEDEDDRRRTHCEFTAIYPKTGLAFGVECKIRQPQGHGLQGVKLGKFVGLVVDALGKQTDHPRVIFVDLNTSAFAPQPQRKDWRDWALHKVHTLETNPQMAMLPPAYVFITNYPDHYHLETIVPDAGAVVEGFKMQDYRASRRMTLREAIETRARHTELEALMASMREHTDIPATFDGEIPELCRADGRLLIGHRYRMDDGRVGVLIDAAVLESKSQVALVMMMEDGAQCLYQGPLSAQELAAWRRYPETFFGQPIASGGECRDVLELYDFFLTTYSKSTKEQLLSFMQHWSDQAALATRAQAELATMYCEALANQAVAMHGPGAV